ncbi:DUF6600 domain-containing protein [Occallatibacter riparius]|uniref:FecR domain-containing protein n=1 Tax=Occallatibacter riparius TaxID=1002689 RepID=A0A9J7BV39_9BACT|nr:DUF6600 domain-containing protein [Occallatibacter riparius]UWZ86740.1 FecR domain-containing protein [Occallatibacter riparius]
MDVVPTSLSRKLRTGWALPAILLLGSAVAFAQDYGQNDQDPPPEAGRLSAINGNVSVQPAGAQDWGQAYANLPLGPGDRIYTDAGSRAEIQVGQTYLRVGPNTDVTLVDATNQAITIGMGSGSLNVHAYGLWQNQQLQVQTPSGTATVYQPTDFRADVYGGQGQDQSQDQQLSAVFTPFNGSVDVAGADGVGATVQAGQSFEMAGTNPVYPQWLQPAGMDDLDQWSRSRDQQVARAQSYQYMSPGMPGGYELDRAGQWQSGTEYGNVWFPNVDQDWAPYRNGHWINREPWGWTWVEDEQWGYAPFHYGRWVNYHNRWGWIPGPREEHPVWSPALVVFAGGMQGGGGDLAAWFPLGPGEAYRPWYRCSPRYVDRVNITNIQPAPRVVVQKTYVNITNVNVTNVTYVNRTMGATAVPREAFAGGRPVRQAAVRVTPQQMQQARVEAKPVVQPTRAAMITRPAAKPVPVKAAPVLINAKGQAVAAKPHAQPQAPPVRQAAAAPRPIPGRQVIAPPPNAKMTPAAQQAAKAHPPAQAGQGQPQNPQGRPEPGNHPQQGNQPVARPGNQPVPQQGARPGNQPVPQQGARPGNQPPNQQPHPMTPPPGAQPGQRPAIPPQTNRPGTQEPSRPDRPGTVPQQRPVPGEPPAARPGEPPAARPGQPPARPATPPQDQSRPERPDMTPQRPGEARPQNPQPGRPMPPPQARPEPQNRAPEPPAQHPVPPPAERTAPPAQRTLPPTEHTTPPPAQRPGPEQRPTPQQQRPAMPGERPGPPPQARPESRPQTPPPQARPQGPPPRQQQPEPRPGTQPDRNHPAPPERDKPKPKPDQNPPQ